jgi:hypothetical protein
LQGAGFSEPPIRPPAHSPSLGVTLAGSGILGTADQAAGAFTVATPVIRVPAAAAPGVVVAAHPEGLNLVTREGNGTNVLFRAQVASGAGDTFNVTVYYSPLYAQDLGC